MRSRRRTGSCCLTAAVLVLFALMPASGHAAAWLPQETVAEGEDQGHALAVAPDGEATVVWLQGGPFPVDVNTIQVWARQISPAGTVGPAQSLAPAGAWPDSPRAAVGSDGRVTVLWLASGGGAVWILKTRQIAPDGTLGPTSTLSAPGLTAQSQWLAVAPDGAVTIAWVEKIGWSGPPREAKAVRIAPDGTVGAATLLSPAGTSVDKLRLAMAPDGRTTVVWRTSTDALQSVRIAADGTPSAVIGLATGIQSDQAFVDVADDGTATVAWLGDTPATLDSVKTLRIAPNGVPGPTQTLAASGATYSSEVAVAPDGTATIVWERPSQVAGVPWAIDSVRIAPNGVAGPVRTVSPSTTSAWRPNLATGPNGATAVVWEDRQGHAMQAAEIAANGTIGAATTIFDDPLWHSSQGLLAFDAAGNTTALSLGEHLAGNQFDLAYRDVQPPAFTTLKLPRRGTPGVPVAFVATAVDHRSGVASTRWDFGDGFTANGPAPKHTYQRAGTFLVRVTVTDDAGNSAAKSHVIVIT